MSKNKPLKTGVKPQFDGPVYQNLRDASIGLKTSEEILKIARSNKCPGFTSSGRIFHNPVEEYLDRNDVGDQLDDSLEGLKKRLLKEQIETLKFKNAIMRGEFWNSEDVKFCVAESMANAVDMVRKFLTPDVYNTFVREINAANALIVDRMVKQSVVNAIRGDNNELGGQEASASKLNKGTSIQS